MTVDELRKALEAVPGETLVIIDGEWPYYRAPSDDLEFGKSTLELVNRVNEGVNHLDANDLGLADGHDKPYIVI